ncbi:hypothetical protein [Bacillus sp. FJAT-27445]|uniref:hypothetical protein n=1 Tax=Bacillus sp. FJAT-27445 TaxID=1679166 RepID=UPI0007440147|nr:hypothetical protein [Bacillus sp. FJAT-27445]
MKAKFNEMMTRFYLNVKERIADERGVSTIEWIGLAAVVVALMFTVSKAMDGQGASLASTIVGKLQSMIGKIGE